MKRPPRSESSKLAKMLGESKYGKQRKSIDPVHPNKGNGLQISNDAVVLDRVICFRHNDRLYASRPFRRLLNLL